MANEKEWQQDISTTVDAHITKLSDHENRLNQAESNIADHEKRIDNIETTTDVGQITLRVNAIEEKNTEQDSAIDTLKSSIRTIEEKNTEQDTSINNLTDLINTKVAGFIKYSETKPTADGVEENSLVMYPAED